MTAAIIAGRFAGLQWTVWEELETKRYEMRDLMMVVRIEMVRMGGWSRKWRTRHFIQGTFPNSVTSIDLFLAKRSKHTTSPRKDFSQLFGTVVQSSVITGVCIDFTGTNLLVVKKHGRLLLNPPIFLHTSMVPTSARLRFESTSDTDPSCTSRTFKESFLNYVLHLETTYPLDLPHSATVCYLLQKAEFIATSGGNIGSICCHRRSRGSLRSLSIEV
jgi:hypothetical protein